ncbi:MAG: HutD family protein [Firmicutes bacterium]|nr:HutD family protein [Bacillota bacterium]
MKIRTIKKDGRRESRWSGGRTWEIAIFPEEASYLDRDFLWRLSTASSDLEESSFTKLPDYDRILMVLEGDVVLAHGDVRTAHLQRLEQDAFDGAVKTRCYGKLIRDYNLIYRKGCCGRMELQPLKPAAAAIRMSPEAADSVCSYGIFCLEGYAVVSCGEESQMLREGDQAVIDFPRGVTEDIRLMGEGSCIVTEVIMASLEGAAGSAEGEAKPEKEGSPEENAEATPAGASPQTAAGGSDYLTSLRLFAGRNRWAMILRREGKSNVYYDRAMAAALRKLEKWYITELIWLVGILLCFAPLAAGSSAGFCLLLAVLFTIVHLFGIIPFVYMRMLPRPFAAHMKKVSDLNAAERAFHEEEIRQDPHFERLMSKYKTDEDGYFNDEASPLYRLARRRDK